MDAVRTLADGAKSYVSEQVAAVKAFNKREALLQGVNLGEHVCGSMHSDALPGGLALMLQAGPCHAAPV